MSKLSKAALFAFVSVVALFSVGCATRRTNTLQYLSFAPSVQGTTVTMADLVVAPRKVIGQATGNPQNSASLRQEAVANALGAGRDANAVGDVLVGANFFYETGINQQTGTRSMTVTVVGYPAVYRNFRQPTQEDAWLFGVNSEEEVIIELASEKSWDFVGEITPRRTSEISRSVCQTQTTLRQITQSAPAQTQTPIRYIETSERDGE